MEALRPEARGQRGLDQKGAHDVVRRANHPLSLAVLRRGEGRGEEVLAADDQPWRRRRRLEEEREREKAI